MHIENDSPAARGARVKKMRQIMALTMDDLAKLLGYSRQTIFSWENADDNGGLSVKGAVRLAEAAKKKGMLCDAQWLLYGSGEINTENNRVIEVCDWMQDTVAKLQSHLKFFKEIKSFLLDHHTAVVAEIQDTCMEPAYEKGDWVGGELISIGANFVGKICIVEVHKNPQIRMIQLGDTQDRFHLTYLKKTPETKADFELKNFTLESTAPITRMWRR